MKRPENFSNQLEHILFANHVTNPYTNYEFFSIDGNNYNDNEVNVH